MFATWTFISIGRRVTQEWNLRFACAVTRFCSSRVKTESYQGGIHSSSFFLFSTLAVPERLWQRRCHSLQQGSVVTPCPAVGPSVLLLYTFCFFVEHRWRSPFFQVFPCSIHLLSTSNNGSIGFTPQTTSKMISLSKDILLVSKIIYPPDDYTTACATCASSVMPTPQSPPPWWSYDSMCNVCIFRNVKEVLVKNVNTPPPHPPPPPPLDDHPTACATC